MSDFTRIFSVFDKKNSLQEICTKIRDLKRPVMDILKAEILKLGGNDEDFELVKNVEDPEDEEWKNPDKDQKDDFNLAEFQKFVQKLNFSGKV